MLRRPTDRAFAHTASYSERLLDEPEAWSRARTERAPALTHAPERGLPAPWRQPYPDEPFSVSAYARPAPSTPRHYSERPRTRTARSDEFRDLAESIEALRNRRAAPPSVPAQRPVTRATLRLTDANSAAPPARARPNPAPTRAVDSQREIERLEAKIRALTDRVAKLEGTHRPTRFAEARERADAVCAAVSGGHDVEDDGYAQRKTTSPARQSASPRREITPRRLLP